VPNRRSRVCFEHKTALGTGTYTNKAVARVWSDTERARVSFVSGSSWQTLCSPAFAAPNADTALSFGFEGPSAPRTLIDNITLRDGRPTNVRKFTADNTEDLLLHDATGGTVQVWSMSGSSYSTIALGSVASKKPFTGDFNGDDRADIAWFNASTGEITVDLMKGGTKLSTASVGTYPGFVVNGVGDFDKDGRSDILLRNNSTGELRIVLLNGTTVKSTPTIGTGVPADWQAVAVGDIDGDGDADIVMRSEDRGGASVWLVENAAKSADMFLGWGIPANKKVAGLGDFNRDGAADIVWYDAANGSVEFWYMTVWGPSAKLAVSGGNPSNWTIQTVADTDGDGFSDLVWRNSNTGDVSRWRMDGTTVLTSAIFAWGVPANLQIVR
jgi:hypothetical protein